MVNLSKYKGKEIEIMRLAESGTIIELPNPKYYDLSKGVFDWVEAGRIGSDGYDLKPVSKFDVDEKPLIVLDMPLDFPFDTTKDKDVYDLRSASRFRCAVKTKKDGNAAIVVVSEKLNDWFYSDLLKYAFHRDETDFREIRELEDLCSDGFALFCMNLGSATNFERSYQCVLISEEESKLINSFRSPKKMFEYLNAEKLLR